MFVMSYFRTEAEALHLAISDDGLEWTALNDNQPLLRAPAGHCIRDPHISQSKNGDYHLFFTTGWQAKNVIGHCTSRDLVSWSEMELVAVMRGVEGVRNCWAPECFYDAEAQLYRLIWSSSVTEPNGEADWNHRIWSCATRDFIEYSKAEIFFDPGFSVIDASVAKSDDGYLMAVKDERGDNVWDTPYKVIHVLRSPHATGPWSEIAEPATPRLTEGPILFRRGNLWMMFYDHFMEGFFGAVESEDGKTWRDITNQIEFPPGPRHASVLEVSDEIVAGLQALIH
jgi:hypothetical protein